jgi:hypothetical protein
MILLLWHSSNKRAVYSSEEYSESSVLGVYACHTATDAKFGFARVVLLVVAVTALLIALFMPSRLHALFPSDGSAGTQITHCMCDAY